MNKSIRGLKKELRQFYLNKRSTLSSKTVLKKSRKITKMVLALNAIQEKNNISCYLPINNEVETKDLIDKFHNQRKNIVIPCFFQEDRKYHFTQFVNWHDLKKGPFGILQPKNPEIFDPSNIEVAILPGLAFAKNGVRLGYGKGVFDRLLSKSNALKISLAYEFQIIDKIPQEKHDIRADLIVTEKTVCKVG